MNKNYLEGGLKMIDPFHVKPETVALKGLLTHHYIITIINVFLSNVITL
jgi:hypothetical protein